MLNLSALKPQHAEALLEIINDGFESAYLGPKEGFLAGTRKSAEEGMLQILASYIKSAKNWKSILLDMADQELILSMVQDGTEASMRRHFGQWISSPLLSDFARQVHSEQRW